MQQQLLDFGLSIHHHDDVAVLALRGELDLYGAEHLTSVVDALLGQGMSRLEIAADGLTFIDSPGFKALLDIRQEAADRGIVLEVVSASERLRWVVEVTGLDGFLRPPD